MPFTPKSQCQLIVTHNLRHWQAKWTVSYMVQDFGMTVSEWYQSTDLTWCDYPIHTTITTLVVLSRLDFRRAIIITRKIMMVPSILYQTLQKARTRYTRSFSLTNIVRAILIWLKLGRGVPRSLIQTSFCASKKSVWLQRSWTDSSRSTNKGRSLFDSSEVGRTWL